MSNYVIDENNNKVPAYSAEEVLSILEQAIENGSLANCVAGKAIVDKLKCCVGGGTFRTAFVSQAKYNELEATGNLLENCYYFITDDTTADELLMSVNGLFESVDSFTGSIKDLRGLMTDMVTGTRIVGRARDADNLSNITLISPTLSNDRMDGIRHIDTDLYSKLSDNTAYIVAIEIDGKASSGIMVYRKNKVNSFTVGNYVWTLDENGTLSASILSDSNVNLSFYRITKAGAMVK